MEKNIEINQDPSGQEEESSAQKDLRREVFEAINERGNNPERAKQIGENWSESHNRLYSEELSKLTLEEFKNRCGKGKDKNVDEIDLGERFEEFGMKVYKGNDQGVNDKERNTALFVEMTCPDCSCKKFFELNNKSKKFNYSFVKNGDVNDVIDGLYDLLSKKGVSCPYCKLRKAGHIE